MSTSRLIVPGLIVSASMVMANAVSAQETLRISFNAAADSTWDAGALRFKELVEERTDGRYSVDIHPNAALANGSDRVEVEMTQEGAIDIMIKSTAWLAELDRRFMALALPFMYSTDDEIALILDGEVGQVLGESLESQGLKPLAWGLGGSFELCTKGRPVNEINDLAGLKIRMPGIRLFVDAYEALGAVPVTMSFAEAFTALQTGTVDADTCGISLLYSSRFYEAVDHIAVTNFSYEAIGLIMNADRLSNLPTEDQEILMASAEEAMNFQREHHIAEEREILERLPEYGMTVTVPDEHVIEEMRDKLAPVIADYRESIGEDFVDMVFSNAGN